MPPKSPLLWLLTPVLLIGLTAAAYQPAWHGGILWDDEGHLTRASLRSLEGLGRIWLDLGATQQYYPLTHSVFWLAHRLWGDATIGYHLLNIVLHAGSACLLIQLLRALRIPGSALAGVVFALHPVQVESVAWMSELKNTLSGILYLASALAYVKFDERRKTRSYVLSLLFFVLALLSKTVTATLPGALIVVLWWKRGTLQWRRDIVPLLPFVAAGAAAGLLTAWVEWTLVGARGPEFALSPIERVLIATRAIWFYAGKLVWPSGLVFNYPRWTIDPADWSQYFYSVAVVAAAAALWKMRKQLRAPLAAFLVFCGTLAPALGFFNVFPFRYAFVADHFQYLASIPVIALFAASVATTFSRYASEGSRLLLRAATVAIAALLGTLTWQQSHHYKDMETLYRSTIARNPSSWLAHMNLGAMKLESEPAEAERHLRIAVQLRPDDAQTRVNLGYALQQLRRPKEALAEYEAAVRLAPRFAEAHNNVCSVLYQMRRPTEAIAACAEALRLSPAYGKAHFNMGLALGQLGHADAVPHLREAVRLNPLDAGAQLALGEALLAQNRFQDAIAQYEQVLSLDPHHAYAHNSLGVALQRIGRTEDALRHFREAVGIDEAFAHAHFNLANALQTIGRTEESLPHYGAVLAINPHDASARTNFGVALQRLGRLDEAIEQFRHALRLNPELLQARENLSRAVAERARAAR